MLGNHFRGVEQKNPYLIKCLENQQFIGFSKEGKLVFRNEANDCNYDFLWIVQSEDQNQQIYFLRFGEIVSIQNIGKNLPLNQNSLMLQYCSHNIDSQVFYRCSKLKLSTNPCVLMKVESNTYLNITNNGLEFKEQKYYFQIIPLIEDYVQEIERPILLNQSKEFLIRNYFTGYELSSTVQFQNEICLTCEFQSNQKWKLQKLNKPKLYQLYNISKNAYVQDLQNDDLLEAKQLFLSIDQQKHSWKIICPKNQEISFGTPFLIQHNINGCFLTVDILNRNIESKSFQVVLKKNIETLSLWVVFNMK